MTPKILPETTEDTVVTLTGIGLLEEEMWGQVLWSRLRCHQVEGRYVKKTECKWAWS